MLCISRRNRNAYQQCFKLSLFYYILVYVHKHTTYLKRKCFSFKRFSLFFKHSLVLYCVNASYFSSNPSPPNPCFTSSQELSFMLEALSHPCFPFLYPFSIFISSYPFCRTPFSPLQLSFFHSVFIAASAAFATA